VIHVRRWRFITFLSLSALVRFHAVSISSDLTQALTTNPKASPRLALPMCSVPGTAFPDYRQFGQSFGQSFGQLPTALTTAFPGFLSRTPLKEAKHDAIMATQQGEAPQLLARMLALRLLAPPDAT
jgi:hypothetical protein